MSQNFLICQNCKNIFFPNLKEECENKLCPHCNSELSFFELTYEEYQTLPKVKRCKRCKRKYPKLFIKCPKCNQQLIKLSTEDNNAIKKIQQIETKIIQKQQNKTTCPYCNSANVTKISTLNRAASIGAFGLASSKVGKQWHCNGCKSDF